MSAATGRHLATFSPAVASPQRHTLARAPLAAHFHTKHRLRQLHHLTANGNTVALPRVASPSHPKSVAVAILGLRHRHMEAAAQPVVQAAPAREPEIHGLPLLATVATVAVAILGDLHHRRTTTHMHLSHLFPRRTTRTHQRLHRTPRIPPPPIHLTNKLRTAPLSSMKSRCKSRCLASSLVS